jgi:hypothetical protein
MSQLFACSLNELYIWMKGLYFADEIDSHHRVEAPLTGECQEYLSSRTRDGVSYIIIAGKPMTQLEQ